MTKYEQNILKGYKQQYFIKHLNFSMYNILCENSIQNEMTLLKKTISDLGPYAYGGRKVKPDQSLRPDQLRPDQCTSLVEMHIIDLRVGVASLGVEIGQLWKTPRLLVCAWAILSAREIFCANFLQILEQIHKINSPIKCTINVFYVLT